MESFPSTPNNEEQSSPLPEVIHVDLTEAEGQEPKEDTEEVDLPPAPPEFNPLGD